MSEPIERKVQVRCSLAHAFAVFTDRIDLWWPPGHRKAADSKIELEPKIGGRFVERNPSGDDRVLGHVVVFEPPHRLTYTWVPGAVSEPTSVEVRFSDQGDHTLVEVTHSEGDAAMGAAWPHRVKIFTNAWTEVLGRLVEFIESEAFAGFAAGLKERAEA